MMLTGENAATGKMSKLRARVAPRNKYSLTSYSVFVPGYGHAMSRILAVQTNDLRHQPRADVFQAN